MHVSVLFLGKGCLLCSVLFQMLINEDILGLFLKSCISACMCRMFICLSVYLCVGVNGGQEMGIRSSEARIKDIFELPEVGTGNQTHNLWRQ